MGLIVVRDQLGLIAFGPKYPYNEQADNARGPWVGFVSFPAILVSDGFGQGLFETDPFRVIDRHWFGSFG